MAENDPIITKEDFEQSLRGTILNIDSSPIRRRWITIGMTSLLTLSSLSWGYIYFIRTEKDSLQKDLANYERFSLLYSDATIAIRSPNASKEALKDSVDELLTLSDTNLRQANKFMSPYIPERYTALVDALEGLCRLIVEKKLDLRVPADKAFYDAQLMRLGTHRIEYYEDSSLEQVPLLQKAATERELQEAMNSTGGITTSYRETLQRRLDEIINHESYTVMAPAVLLGKWYRYFNDLENAQRCFDIARKYVDGYTLLKTNYDGQMPTELGPAWDEYVEALNGLAEIAIENKSYRIARSYLFRIFKTPNTNFAASNKKNNVSQLEEIEEKIQNLQYDIKIIGLAIQDPRSIQSFPLFQDDHRTVIWPALLRKLQLSPHTVNAKQPIELLWSRLNPNIQRFISTGDNFDNLSTPFRYSIIDALNQLIVLPDFYLEAHYDASILVPRSKQLLKEIKTRDLTPDEYAFINRDIIDQTFGDALNKYLQLSDGSRISNKISPEKAQILIRLYQDEMEQPSTETNRIDELNRKIYRISSKNYIPEINDYYEEIENNRRYYQSVSDQLEKEYDTQRSSLKQLKDKSTEFEIRGTLDANASKQIQDQMQLLEYNQQQILITRNGIGKKIDELTSYFNGISDDLNLSLKRMTDRLYTLKSTQQNISDKQINLEGTIVQQLGKHLNLRKKYLNALLLIKDPETNKKIIRLLEEKNQLQEQIDTITFQLPQLTNSPQEIAQLNLSELHKRITNIILQIATAYQPLTTAINQIAQEEERTWKLQDQLASIHAQIDQLIGTDDKPGYLRTLIDEREHLISTQIDSTDFNVDSNARISELNQQINQGQAIFGELIEAESISYTMLDALTPTGIANQRPIAKENFIQLYNKIQHIQSSIHEYTLLQHHNELEEQSYFLQKIIADNFQKIYDNIQLSKNLTDTTTEQFGRYMQNIIQARANLSDIEQKKRLLLDSKSLSSLSDDENKMHGIYLRQLELFELENEMGFHVTEFRRIFDKRNTIAQNLQESLNQRNSLEKERVSVLQGRDQVQLDQLQPEISTLENKISTLSTELLDVDKNLSKLIQEYLMRYQKIEEYRTKLENKIKHIHQEVHLLQKEILDRDEALTQLSNTIFTQALTDPSTPNLPGVQTYADLDALIQREEDEIGRLERFYILSQRENFYKAKAIWNLAKTYQSQSLLPTYELLVSSTSLPADIEQDEQRLLRPVFDEFDTEWIYSDNMLGPDAGIEDKNNANYLSWVDFLEKSAIRLYQQELPKYAIVDSQLEPKDYFKDKQFYDNILFLADSKFNIAQIYLRRAQRLVNAFKHPHHKSNQVQQELDLATSSLIQFLDFSSRNARLGNAIGLTYERSDSQEFPEPQRYPYERDDEARLYLGVIAYLKKNPQLAIDTFEEMLRKAIVMSRIKYDQSNTALPIGAIEHGTPLQYLYNHFLNPDYVSLLGTNDILVEAIYRLAKSHHEIALENHEEAQDFEKSLDPHQSGYNDSLEKMRISALRSIAYYSQIIHTQPYSPYRQSAIFHRAMLYKLLSFYDAAQQDLLMALGQASTLSVSSSWADCDIKGDLPSELNPTYTRLCYELGSIALENQDYFAAVDILREANNKGFDPKELARAKIAYAKALIGAKKWTNANHFLTKLIADRAHASDNEKSLYPIDIFLNLGITLKEMLAFNSSISAFKQVFQCAPKSLLTTEGLLDLSKDAGLDLLERDYRDSIRPLCLACFHIAEISFVQKNYYQARDYYQKSLHLARMLIWKEDPELSKMSKDDFHNYRQYVILTAKWGFLKCDLSELLFSSMSNFHKDVVSDQPLTPKELIKRQFTLVQQALNDLTAQKDTYLQYYDKLNAFYIEEYNALPEIKERQRIVERRNILRQQMSPAIKQYDALIRLKKYLAQTTSSDPEFFISKIKETYPVDTLEGNFLEQFALYFADRLQLTTADRESLQEDKSNLDNLLLLPNRQQKFQTFFTELQTWLRLQIQRTNLNEDYLAVSRQASVLEEIDLYRVSFLATLNRRDDYILLRSIVDDYIKNYHTAPNRLINLENYFSLLEIGAISAEEQGEWPTIERYNRELLSPEKAYLFIQADKSDLYRAQLALATALIELTQQLQTSITPNMEKLEKISLEKEITSKIAEARTILKSVQESAGGGSTDKLSRIRASQLLQRIS